MFLNKTMANSYLDGQVETGHERDIWSDEFYDTWLLLAIPGVTIAATIVVSLMVVVIQRCKGK